MKLAATIFFRILSVSALAFCVAYVVDQLWKEGKGKGGQAAEREKQAAEADVSAEISSAAVARGSGALDVNTLTAAASAESFVDRLLEQAPTRGSILLEGALDRIEDAALEDRFAELMARDLENGKSIPYASRLLREIARRAPERAVSILYAMRPAERESLAIEMARGWTQNDYAGAFDWIQNAWVDAEGGFIDREFQNALYRGAIETLAREEHRYAESIGIIEGVEDPDLRRELVVAVAKSLVADGPESALERIGSTGSDAFDTAVLDAVADEWAKRDSLGAMQWSLANETELSTTGVRSIAKQLAIGDRLSDVTVFFNGLATVPRRDAVAAEVTRLTARRTPVASAGWAVSIVEPSVKREAVLDAIREIGYDSFEQSVDYVDYVYPMTEPDRAPVLASTLKDWIVVDRTAVVEYLISDRAGLPDALSEEILLTEAAAPSI